MRKSKLERFKELAAGVAATPVAERNAAAYAAAREVASRFGTARVLLVFVFVVNSIGRTTGVGRADAEDIAALAGLPVEPTEAILADLQRAGFIALYGRGKSRCATLPFVPRWRSADRARARLCMPAVATVSQMQH